MNRIYIDSNIFLSLLYKDENKEAAKKILYFCESGECSGFTSTFIFTEVLFILEKRGYDIEQIKDAIEFIAKHTNIMFLSPTINTFRNSINFKMRGLKILDSLHTSIMQDWGINYIASFDPDFDKIKEIKRITAV